MEPVEVLKQYWGYSSFRPLQLNIIQSILEGNDTLAILPTGGGKSICFQVPGMLTKGITVVVSPLISLMNDQVDNLKKRGINAIALHSGLGASQTEIELKNIQNQMYRFVYVSPERLKSIRFRAVLEDSGIGMLAIDEAHCISQWGYDFRPDYKLIAELRNVLKKVPCIALTASANPAVQKDIMESLNMGVKAKFFSDTVVRPNLIYEVYEDENKNQRILRLTKAIAGTGIVFVRNRKATASLAALINRNGDSADYYHAGMTYNERLEKQEAWQQGKTRIMVCTNAFGMGIDKSNVRFVIHYELPESLEAYYQEAGRAGRDGKESRCILLYCKPDAEKASMLLANKFIKRETVEMVYQAMCNQLQIAIGAGFEQSFEVDVPSLAEKASLTQAEIYASFDILVKEGLIELTDAFTNPSKLQVLVNERALLELYKKNQTAEPFLKTILRMYGGLFDNPVPISEFEIAKNLKISVDRVREGLQRLDRLNYVNYLPQNSKPCIVFTMARPANMPYNEKRWKFLQQMAEERLHFMLDYCTKEQCRQKAIAAYFGELNTKSCGKCDFCKSQLNDPVQLLKQFFTQNPNGSFTLETLLDVAGDNNTGKDAIRFLLDKNHIVTTNQKDYQWKG